ncbi:ImmA/IrrE family metallo-endopeptidase [Alkalihalobacillus macyae]|uniref:ImmA/IrrE family metallo-endopeptidase n=1 Tax=Guptibacillus hwajinpoensis TaxID=208199 RepID=UPI00273B17CD|nr:ImmA/IrrE family metallo-endopeptidase [Alkalihalobacillus macyae]MDP4549831.1 ImmA/IrrE family metallo-endopeptidase [Alkalihalobacillus macyae]
MIPNSVRVSGLDYQVEEKPFVQIGESKDYLGCCSYSTTTIELLDSMSDDRKEQVFVHELTHAIFNEAGYDQHEEDMINRVAIVLYQVLKDNEFHFNEHEGETE